MHDWKKQTKYSVKCSETVEKYNCKKKSHMLSQKFDVTQKGYLIKTQNKTDVTRKFTGKWKH